MSRHTTQSASRRVIALLAPFLFAAALNAAHAQPAAAAAAQPNSAQPTSPDYRFEVATIKPSGPPDGHPKGPLNPYSPGLYRQDNPISLATLAFKTFAIKHGYQIEYPNWMATAWFTLDATLPEGAAKPDVPSMLRHLLEDRFSLTYHRVTHQIAGYQLVVVKPSANLAPHVPQPPGSITPVGDGFGDIEVKNGVPQFAKNAGSGVLCYGHGTCVWRGRGKTMADLASDLADKLQAPVADSTGLAGPYDYTLTFTDVPMPTPGAVAFGPPGAMTAGAVATDTDAPLDHPLIREALQDQLGLKLVPIKSVSVEVIVIDSANKQPTPN